ncbi:MAG TPA: agmatine deiminase, partial [Propionibacteriaceae bacterium]|nr:agmatine deiminase [Propionibacteriaceae bacterium]
GQVVAALDNDPASFDYAVTRAHLDILKAATDVTGKPLVVTPLVAPRTLREQDPGEDFAAGYINFYLCNGGVIAPQFGDADADAAARDALAALFPQRKVVQLNVDGIAAGGGG